MSVSEWSLPLKRGGVAGQVENIRFPPSARASGPAHWALAKQHGLKTMAKVQANCTWELSAVPYLPAMNLVGRHLNNLTRAGVDGMMLSWSLGGYPSPNLQLVRQFSRRPVPALNDALAQVARDRFGAGSADNVLRAWATFSVAFSEFPYDASVIYCGPCQMDRPICCIANPPAITPP